MAGAGEVARRAFPSFVLEGRKFYVVPEQDAAAAGLTSATKVDRAQRGRTAKVRAARRASELTQAELAERLGVTPVRVSRAETGADRISDGYVASVIEACGLPSTWEPPKK